MPSGVPSLPFPRFLAPPTSPPPSAVRRSSRWRYGPTRGPTPGRVPPTAASSHRPRPSLPPAALCTGAPTWLPPPGRGGEGAYPPRPPASASGPPAPLDACPPQLRPRPRPSGEELGGHGAGVGGPNLGGPSRSPHPTGTCLLHISNSFLSHFLAGGGVSQTPPRSGLAPGLSARLPPGSSLARPRPRLRARPLARRFLPLLGIPASRMG